MFKKFITIQNLARFENPGSCASCEFLKWNVIFGDNGRGKSTITAIFRSVGENKSNHLLARQTLGQSNKPKVELLFDTTAGTGTDVAKFDGSVWDKNPQSVLVFDQDFIDGNVLIGGRVDYAQKRGLYEVFVGRQTGSLVEQIAEEDEVIRKLNPQIAEINARLLGHKKSDITIKQFIDLKKIDTANDPIPGLEKQLEIIQNKTKVLQSPVLQKVVYVPPDLEKLNTVLKTSVKTLSAEVTKAVKTKVASIGQPDAETWIERGHQFCEHTNGECPFCGQPLATSEIAKHYEEYFNKEYTTALTTLHDYHHEVTDGLNVGSLVTLGRLIGENDKRFEYWQSLSVKGLEEIKFEIDELQGILTELLSLVEGVLSRKLQDPLTAIELPEQLSNTIDTLTAKLEQLKQYNEDVERNNKLVEGFKADLLKSDNGVEIKQKLYLAYDQRTRHTTAVDKQCSDYVKLSAEKKTHEQSKAQLRDTLDSSSKQIIEQHQTAINDCLKKSGASFTLQRIDQDHVGGRPNSTFVLEINGEEIVADSYVEDAPNIKTALSGGDKTTLAFAFFVSCVIQDTKLASTLLVIDDPISSLDYGRRTHTLNTIFDLFSKSAQGILLSHDPDFLHGIWTKMGILPDKRASFQIKRDGQRASKLASWDVEKQTESEQKARINKLESFVDNGLAGNETQEQIITNVRPMLEHAYKAIYPKEFPSSSSLGEFIGKVKASNEPYLANIKTRISRVEAVNDYVMPHSSHDPSNTVPSINETELLTNTKEALELLRY